MNQDKDQEYLQDMIDSDEGIRLGDYVYDKSGECIGVIETKEK